MKLMKDYSGALTEIYKHVGIDLGAEIYPVEDYSEKYWSMDDYEVLHANTEKDLMDQDKTFGSDEIYRGRHYNQAIYVGEELTLILCYFKYNDCRGSFKAFNNKKRIIL